jgi:hypothetical protein
MSKDNAKRVVRVATIYPAFRTALRADPGQALSLFAKDLHLEGDHPLDESEIKALVSISDEEFAALARIAASLGDSLENGEAPMSCFML